MSLHLSSIHKSQIFFFFIFLFINANFLSAQKTYLGVNIGLSINDLTEDFNWRNYVCRHGCEVTDVSPQSGRYYGLSFQKDLSSLFALKVGLAYERFGFEETIESTVLIPITGLNFKGKPVRTQIDTYTSTYETSYAALSLPIAIRYYILGHSNSDRLFLDGGLVYHYKLNESFTPYDQNSNTLYEHNFSAMTGLGYEKRWNAHLLYVSTSFSYSVTNWNHDEIFQRNEKFRPIQMRLNLGYGYAFN